MSDERRVEAEVELPVTPEQAWEAIATGPGISAWFVPAEVDGRVGGSVVHRPDPEMESTGRITAYDPPHRFAYEEPAWAPDGGEPVTPATATEFLVEARSGGTCVVRVVMSALGDEGDWERAAESFGAGWRQAFLSLRLYLTHFPGEPAAAFSAGTVARGGNPDAVWRDLLNALGLPGEPRSGDRLEVAAAGAPPLAGTVELAEERMATLVLDEPAGGIGFVGAGGPGDDVFVFVRGQLFGAGAAGAAERAQEDWRRWFAERLAGAAG